MKCSQTQKVKIILLPGADVGTSCGYEFEHKRRPYLFQDWWFFQQTIPVEKSRYTLHLPPSWEYRADWINHSEQKPVGDRQVHLYGRSPTFPESKMNTTKLPDRALAGQDDYDFLFGKSAQPDISFMERPCGLALAIDHRIFGSQSRPFSENTGAGSLHHANARPNQGSIRFAQRDIRYAAIEVGIGGSRPHPADESLLIAMVIAKTKLPCLSTMLTQIGVKSFYMPINAIAGIYTEKTPPNSASTT